MISLEVKVEIEDGDFASEDPNPKHGVIDMMGCLPRGMTSGAPSFAARIRLDDGTYVIAEQSWKSVGLGMVALIAKWGTP